MVRTPCHDGRARISKSMCAFEQILSFVFPYLEEHIAEQLSDPVPHRGWFKLRKQQGRSETSVYCQSN
mgnify:CR=1 FL=1